MDVRIFYRVLRMDIFKSAGIGRGTNDANNKARESILAGLYDSVDPYVQDLRIAWKSMLKTLCPIEYDSVRVRQKGGRGANHDFEIDFISGSVVVKEVISEFKHNCSRIDKLPEYFSPSADKPYMPRLYADVFYETYLDSICNIYPEIQQHKPEKEVYLKLVHNDNYDRHPFFRALYDAEVKGSQDQYKQKQQIVRDSIRSYLTEFSSKFDVAELSKDIRSRQSGKVFILWNLKDFITDIIHDDEMEITHIDGIKNGNTLVAVSKAGTKHNMLLRWKNHLGILYPAWQISLTR